ncbi:MAG TPA: hypothetical protein VE775_04740 [Pyrinomonadaceae bacterium]|jgi:hypothetical protein|nr:hypothetical protein [Pyrinomonadaceae bacterium]
MFSQVLRFVRLPLLLITLYAIGRFSLGLIGVPYAPRGNAIFSVLGLAVISSIYFGALSGRVGGFGWLGTLLVGFIIGEFAQILIFAATLISYVAHLNTYYIHWDALNIPEGTTVPMARALTIRAGGLAVGSLLPIIAALIGRLLGKLAPTPRGELGMR